MAKKKENASSTKNDTTTQIEKDEGLVKKAMSSTFGKLRSGMGKLIKGAFKGALIVGGACAVEQIAEQSYEKATGNDIKWDFKLGGEEGYGIDVKKVTNPSIYVGNSSTVTSSRGHEFDGMMETDDGFVVMEADAMQ